MVAMGKPITRSHSQNLCENPSPQTTNMSLSSSSKIPFRPKKIRKITTTTTTKSTTNAITVTATVAVKPLSLAGEIGLALDHLRDTDPLLSTLISAHKPPAFEPSSCLPFLSLSRSILYQQLAPSAAKSIYKRFLALCGGESGVNPDNVLALSPQQLREIGISGRKASYLHDLSDKYRAGLLSDASILEMDDETLLESLTKVKGIGVWSVHMFMMFSLHRPDVLPVGDLGVRKGVQSLYGLKALPAAAEMEEVCEKWRPFRSVGAWYMWRLMEAKALAKKAVKKGR